MPRLLELFSGTGSVGKVFQARGWEVVSVDITHNGDYPPTHQCDIMQFDYTMYSEGYFDVIHASPPCQQYSLARSRAKTPRDLEGSDKLVMQTKRIIEYLKPNLFWIENPATGLLRTRPCMVDLKHLGLKVCYCMYQTDETKGYRKSTMLWSNIDRRFFEPKYCCPASRCIYWYRDTVTNRGKHPSRAQRENHSLHELYHIPIQLCRAMCDACERHLDSLTETFDLRYEPITET